MKQSDILALMDAIAPGIAASFAKAVVPLLARLEVAEKRVNELEAGQASRLDELKQLGDLEQLRKLVPTVEQIAATLPKALTSDDVHEIVSEHVGVVKGNTVEGFVRELVADTVAALPKPKDGKDVDLEYVKMVVDEAVESLPPAAPGKDADPVLIKALVDDAVKALPPAAPGKDAVVDVDAIVLKVAELIPVPKDGKDADQEAIEALILEKVAAIPRVAGKDGESVKPEVIKAMVDEAVAAIPRIVQDGKDASPEQIAVAVEKALASWERPKDGKSVTLEEVAPMVEEVVAKHVAKLPVPKDGVGLAGGMIDREGDLTLTLTDGSVRELGNVLGKDGMGFDDFEVVDGEDEFVFRMKLGDREKNWSVRKPSVADFYRGVWTAGLHKRGSLVTWGGSLWMAQRDTEVKPETKGNEDDWKLVVKRGRDGKDAQPSTNPPANTKITL